MPTLPCKHPPVILFHLFIFFSDAEMISRRFILEPPVTYRRFFGLTAVEILAPTLPPISSLLLPFLSLWIPFSLPFLSSRSRELRFFLLCCRWKKREKEKEFERKKRKEEERSAGKQSQGEKKRRFRRAVDESHRSIKVINYLI